MNTTKLPFVTANSSAEYFPFYYVPRPSILGFISDSNLSLAAPVIAYWAYSLFFFALDASRWSWLERCRIHQPAEVESRNRASVSEVVHAVLLQQAIQTALGYYWMDVPSAAPVIHSKAMLDLHPTVLTALGALIGPRLATTIVDANGMELIYVLYWWIIPAIQFLIALMAMDTWQYFLHRLFHTNKFLYRKFHSVHHRLYVPYAFGALYNHWFEGLLMDSLGAVVSHSLSLMTVRQAILLFTFSTLKTVDDHSGYVFPLDPFQALFPNNAAYHDVHHQVWGIKHNFSQPFYVHWDTILGTRYEKRTSELKADKAKKL